MPPAASLGLEAGLVNKWNMILLNGKDGIGTEDFGQNGSFPSLTYGAEKPATPDFPAEPCRPAPQSGASKRRQRKVTICTAGGVALDQQHRWPGEMVATGRLSWSHGACVRTARPFYPRLGRVLKNSVSVTCPENVRFSPKATTYSAATKRVGSEAEVRVEGKEIP
jgi:hypothetical protein